MNTVMKKRKYKHINWVGMALLLALFSCSDDGMPRHSGGKGGEQVPLRVASATAGNGIGIETRAAGVRDTLNAGSIGIFLKEDVANGYKALTNLRFDYATPFWQTDEQILLGEPNATLAAYYPYSAGKVNPVMLRCQLYSRAEDLHYVNFEANSEVSDVTLNLSRVYSRIVFTFNKHTSYTGDGHVTSVHFDGRGITPVAMLDMLDLSVTGVLGGSIRDILDPITGLHVAEIKGFDVQFTAAAPGEVDCLMIPAELTGDIAFSAIVDGQEMTGKVTAEQLCGSGGILAEGVKYAVNITVKPARIEVGAISRTDWEPATVEGDYVIQ